MCNLSNSTMPVKRKAAKVIKTWCEACGSDTPHSQLVCSPECADWLVRDAISRDASHEEIKKYKHRRDRMRRRLGLPSRRPSAAQAVEMRA